ncbi:MAG: hypothetical protein JNJ54_16945 [Myxococcaceae bacterium]|nr:hypothetical protein [Myxococcaceae bacterium]
MNKNVVAAGVLLASLAFAQVPDRLGYSGRLLRANGTPETGTVSLTFSLYDSASGGSQLWTEQQMVMLTSDGLYATTLGASTAIPGSVFDGSTAGSRYLEISVNGSALVPRQLINSVPWALTAKNVRGGTVDATGIRVNSQDLLVNGRLSPSFGYQAGNGVTIDSNNVISLPSCTAGQVLVWNASNQWACGSATGPAGQSVTTMTEPAGMNCANGGVRLTSVSGTSYVCNGATGMQGTPGQSVTVATETAGMNCATGGLRLTSTSGTNYVCNGAAGPTGTAGQSVAVVAEAAGMNCANGGVRLTSASGTNYVCNGAAGAGGGGNGRNLFLFDSSPAQWTTTSTGTPMSVTANTMDSAEGDGSFDFAYGNVAASTGIVGVWGTDFIQVDPTKVYEGRIKAKSTSGTFLGTFWAGFIAYDAAKQPLQGPASVFLAGTTRCVPFIANNVAAAALNATTWTQFVGRVTSEGGANNNFPTGTRYIKPCVGTNLTGIGTTRVDAFEIFEVDQAAGFSNVAIYRTAGTFTLNLPTGVTKVWARAWGGGGGGGNTVIDCTNLQYYPGGGGGSGGYAEGIFTVASGATLSITVGGPGAAGAGPSGCSGSGGSGGTSTVVVGAVTLVSGGGGAGGSRSSACAAAPGGAGGAGSGSGTAVTFTGSTGGTGIAVNNNQPPPTPGGIAPLAPTGSGSGGSSPNGCTGGGFGSGSAGQPGLVWLYY